MGSHSPSSLVFLDTPRGIGTGPSNSSPQIESLPQDGAPLRDKQIYSYNSRSTTAENLKNNSKDSTGSSHFSSFYNQKIFLEEVWKVIRGWKFVTIFGLSLLVVGIISLSLTIRLDFFRFMASVSSFILCFLIFSVFCLSQMTWSDGFFMIVGLGYGFVGFNQLLGRGIGLIPGAVSAATGGASNREIQLTQLSSIIEILSLYAGIFLARKTFRGWKPTAITFASFFLVETILLCMLFWWNIWPLNLDPNDPNLSKVTTFYTSLNYAFLGFFVVIWILLILRRKAFSVDVFVYLMVSILLRIIQVCLNSQVADYSMASDITGTYVLASLTRVLSYTYLFLSVGVTTLRNPMETLYRNLTIKQNALQNEKVLVAWMIEQVPAIAILLDDQGGICHMNSYGHHAFRTASTIVHANFFDLFTFEDRSACFLQFENLVASNDPNNFITLKSHRTTFESNRVIEWTIKMVKSTTTKEDFNIKNGKKSYAKGNEFEMDSFLNRSASNGKKIRKTYPRSPDRHEQVQVLCLGKDVTDKAERMRLLTEARNNAERLALMKDTFVANVSHELRTPLNCIVGVTDLIQHSVLTETQKGMVSMIKTAANSLLSLISDLLDFAKLNDGQLKLIYAPIDLRQFIETSILSLSVLYQNNLDFGYRITKDCPKYIENDENRLRQILFNLMSNAIKFTHKGQILVLISMVENPSSSIPFLQFSIKDSGVGVKPADLKMLFERFFQASDQGQARKAGTGIGLAITKQFVELMGGSISIDSEYGHGTTVSFKIPVVRPVASLGTPGPIDNSRHASLEPSTIKSDPDSVPSRTTSLIDSEDTEPIRTSFEEGRVIRSPSSGSKISHYSNTTLMGNLLAGKTGHTVVMCFENEVISKLMCQQLGEDYNYHTAYVCEVDKINKLLDDFLAIENENRPTVISIVSRPPFLEVCDVKKLEALNREGAFIQIICLVDNSTSPIPQSLHSLNDIYPMETLPKTIPMSQLLRVLRRGSKRKTSKIKAKPISSVLTNDKTLGGTSEEAKKEEDTNTENDSTEINILVVEDNKTNQKVMQLMLDKIGNVKYDIAENGQEAVDKFTSHPRAYDCILMDCQMPVMDGPTATQIIRKMESEDSSLGRTHIAALTANALAEEKEKCLAVGMDDWMTKPITFQAFSTKLEWLKDQRRQKDSSPPQSGE